MKAASRALSLGEVRPGMASLSRLCTTSSYMAGLDDRRGDMAGVGVEELYEVVDEWDSE